MLTTPYVMFESKKTHILIAHQKEDLDGTKKVQLRFRGFFPCFWEVDHPLYDV
jgi:hypothetical protein